MGVCRHRRSLVQRSASSSRTRLLMVRCPSLRASACRIVPMSLLLTMVMMMVLFNMSLLALQTSC